MLDCHYDVIDKQLGKRANLIYSGADSFVYEIEHEDIYKWQQHNEDSYFDMSDSKRPDVQSDNSKKKLGQFKDELHSQILLEFIALSPTCYGYRYQSYESNEILKRTRHQRESVMLKRRRHYHSHYTREH